MYMHAGSLHAGCLLSIASWDTCVSSAMSLQCHVGVTRGASLVSMFTYRCHRMSLSYREKLRGQGIHTQTVNLVANVKWQRQKH